MKAVVATEYGPPERLEVADLPAPLPGRGQIQVRIAAAPELPQKGPLTRRNAVFESARFADLRKGPEDQAGEIAEAAPWRNPLPARKMIRRTASPAPAAQPLP